MSRDDPPDLARDQRRESFGRLVENQQVGIGQERAADRQHLLLAARQLIAAVTKARGEPRKYREHALLRPVAAPIRSRARGHQQIFAHVEIGEDAAALGDIGDPIARDSPWRRPRCLRSAHEYRAALRRHEPEHALG